ncbi:hypothetical protein ElyMa_000089300 [Elysia marginata]|uniref:SAM domain-containing protein n=1 Tax=Elysia marginata TaxID=1093978 RepID=A0AAV4EJQ3_9GAST|nr:hypothetical protein ElyMa_000089300 [Elysia marginata]
MDHTGTPALRGKQCLFFVVICFICVGALLHYRATKTDSAMVSEWLTRNSLGYISDVVIQAGSANLGGALSAVKNVKKNKKLSKSLSREQHKLLEKAVDRLEQELELEMWLKANHFGYCTELLKKKGVLSLHELSRKSDEELQVMLEQGGLHGDDPVFFSQLVRLRLDLSSGHALFPSKAVLAHANSKSSYSSIKLVCLVVDARLSDQEVLGLSPAFGRSTLSP